MRWLLPINWLLPMSSINATNHMLAIWYLLHFIASSVSPLFQHSRIQCRSLTIKKDHILHESQTSTNWNPSAVTFLPKNRVNVFQPKRTRSWHTPIGMRQRNEASTSFAISHTNSCPWRITPRFPKERPGGVFCLTTWWQRRSYGWFLPGWKETHQVTWGHACVSMS